MVVTNFYVHALYKGSMLINVSVMNCIDRYVNVKQKCETIIPQITSLYTLRHCSGRLMVQYQVKQYYVYCTLKDNFAMTIV